MLTLLYISLIVNIIAVAVAFFMLISTSFMYAIGVLLVGAFSIVSLLIAINYIEGIEALKVDFSRLQSKVKHISDLLSKETTAEENENPSPISQSSEPAKATWECVKCGTVNKSGTSRCALCKADYSPSVNPTDNPYAKKKISRFVKFK